MNSVPKNIFIVLSFLVFLTGNAKAAVRVSARVDTSKDIYAGENFGCYIIIEGSDKAGQVDLTALQKYNPQHTGNKQQSSTQIINNRITTSQSIIMTYSLTVSMPGQIKLPPVTVTLDGRQYRTNSVQLNILKPGETDKLDFEVVLSEQKCYVGQPVIMTVKFYVSTSTDVGEFQFNLPVLTNDSFYIEEPEISDPQAKLYRLNSGTTAHVSQRVLEHKGESFVLVSFNKVLIPKHPGQIDIGTSSVSVALAVGRVRSRDPFFDNFSFFSSQKKYQRFAVNSLPLKLTVLPLPEQGKPDGFYGLVGRYTISASAAPTRVNVGDPITLKIKISGGKYLKPVKWPALEQIPELANNFKIPLRKRYQQLKTAIKCLHRQYAPATTKLLRYHQYHLLISMPIRAGMTWLKPSQ